MTKMIEVLLFRPVLNNSLICTIWVGYTHFFLTLNRCLPVVIAIFRYVYVFHWNLVVSEYQKAALRKKCYIYLFLPSIMVAGFSIILPRTTKHYNRCMGKEEQYFFNIPFFLEETAGGPLYKLPLWHPFRLIALFLFDINLFIVPYAYIKIFNFRKNLRMIQHHGPHWKRRNIVSTGYNMAIWLVEGFISIAVRNISLRQRIVFQNTTYIFCFLRRVYNLRSNLMQKWAYKCLIITNCSGISTQKSIFFRFWCTANSLDLPRTPTL